jgi:hypothetical protein
LLLAFIVDAGDALGCWSQSLFQFTYDEEAFIVRELKSNENKILDKVMRHFRTLDFCVPRSSNRHRQALYFNKYPSHTCTSVFCTNPTLSLSYLSENGDAGCRCSAGARCRPMNKPPSDTFARVFCTNNKYPSDAFTSVFCTNPTLSTSYLSENGDATETKSRCQYF